MKQFEITLGYKKCSHDKTHDTIYVNAENKKEAIKKLRLPRYLKVINIEEV